MASQHPDVKLLEAASAGDVCVCKDALKAGANINARDRAGETALIIAVNKAHEELCLFLIANGADLTIASGAGHHFQTVLMAAAEKGLTRVVNAMLEHGADVNARNEVFGSAAIIFAAAGGNVEVCRALLDKGADANDWERATGTTPIMAAAKAGHTDVCKLLIERGADVNAGAEQKQSALKEAAFRGRASVCRVLIEHGANVNLADGWGVTPLMAAAGKGHLEVCQVLLDNGANVAAVDEDDGFTALLHAASGGTADVCERLIASGATVDAVDTLGRTALMIAALSGKADICRVLLANGADVDVEDDSKKTALKYAKAGGYEEICAALGEVEDGKNESETLPSVQPDACVSVNAGLLPDDALTVSVDAFKAFAQSRLPAGLSITERAVVGLAAAIESTARDFLEQAGALPEVVYDDEIGRIPPDGQDPPVEVKHLKAVLRKDDQMRELLVRNEAPAAAGSAVPALDIGLACRTMLAQAHPGTYGSTMTLAACDYLVKAITDLAARVLDGAEAHVLAAKRNVIHAEDVFQAVQADHGDDLGEFVAKGAEGMCTKHRETVAYESDDESHIIKGTGGGPHGAGVPAA